MEGGRIAAGAGNDDSLLGRRGDADGRLPGAGHVDWAGHDGEVVGVYECDCVSVCEYMRVLVGGWLRSKGFLGPMMGLDVFTAFKMTP